MLPAFADAAEIAVKTPPGTPWWVTVGLMAISGAGVWLYKVYRAEQVRKTAEAQRKRTETVEDADKERKHKKEDENAIIAELKLAIDRLKSDREDDRKKHYEEKATIMRDIFELRQKLEETIRHQREAEKARYEAEKVAIWHEAQSRHLAGILKSRKIPFELLSADDSTTLRAVSPPPAWEPEEDTGKGDF